MQRKDEAVEMDIADHHRRAVMKQFRDTEYLRENKEKWDMAKNRSLEKHLSFRTFEKQADLPTSARLFPRRIIPWSTPISRRSSP
jgi:hypothetical protein